MIRAITNGAVWWGLKCECMRTKHTEDQLANFLGAWFRVRPGHACHGVRSLETWDADVGTWRNLTEVEFGQALIAQKFFPVKVAHDEGGEFWLYKGSLYKARRSCDRAHVKVLVDTRDLTRLHSPEGIRRPTTKTG
jgi:hypothetical protein